jgi:chromosome segregation ATPase
LKQTMDWLLGFEKLLSNSAVKLGQDISSEEQVISSLQNQITQLNQDISTLQQKTIPSLQHAQQVFNDAANTLQDYPNVGLVVSVLRAEAKVTGDLISQLQNEVTSKQQQVKLLQALVIATQKGVAGLTETLNGIKEQLVKLTGEWYTDNAIYNDNCT